MQLTDKEIQVIHGIKASDYYEHGLDSMPWVFSIRGPIQGKALGGVLASLKKKGLINLDEDDGDAFVSWTEAGKDLVNTL